MNNFYSSFFFFSDARDERRGWMGDASLTVDEALYNFDLIKFYHNFLNLIVDNQLNNGELPNYVPASNSPSDPEWGADYPPDPNWATALPTITWHIYRHYNDVQTLKMYYDHIIAHVNYFYGLYNTTGLANFTNRFGDSDPPPPQPWTNIHLVGSFAFLHDVYLVINMSQVLGKTKDTETYSALYQQLAEEFHRVFFDTSHNFYANGLQSAQVLALALPNVVPTNVRNQVINHLVNDINQKDNHVSTGIISTAQIYPVLSDNGHHDLALELISSTTYPSYGYMFNNPYENATTIWEIWNTATGDPHMDSRNQAMLGSVGAWFYSHLAGIDLSPKMITIHPRMASEPKKHLMSKLHCQLSTLYGLVQISYTRDERDTKANSILLHVTIPPNAQARVMFEPLFVDAQCKTLMEGNQVIWSSNINITSIEFHVKKDSTNGLMTVHIGSGEYVFHALWQ
jgi:alpha-L-rhamnosidase